MSNKLFLESYPLYRKYEVTIEPVLSGMYGYRGTTLERLAKPAINMHCRECQSLQTFNMINNYWDDDKLPYTSSGPVGHTFRLKYQCAGCRSCLILIYVEFGKTTKEVKKLKTTSYWIRKIGQNPPWEIGMDEKLAELLGIRSELYKKGLTNESQGYGIGAHAYFRRITEELIDDLLDQIYELISPEEKEIYKKALNEAKKTRVAQEKIDLVKDLLPDSLKPDGMNPLGIIHSALSEGLHDLSDEECIEQAAMIRDSLTFLVNQVVKTKNESKHFTESMRRILDKKTKIIDKDK